MKIMPARSGNVPVYKFETDRAELALVPVRYAFSLTNLAFVDPPTVKKLTWPSDRTLDWFSTTSSSDSVDSLLYSSETISPLDFSMFKAI